MNPSLRGLLLTLFRRICGNYNEAWRWFLEDRLWAPGIDRTTPPERRLLDLASAVKSGLVADPGSEFRAVGAGGSYVGLATPGRTAGILDGWWPSQLGVLAGWSPGICRATEQVQTVDSAEIGEGCLNEVQDLLSTSRAFDNQGWDVAVRGRPWSRIKEELEAQGFVSGTPLVELGFQIRSH
ncbi:MAG TPA: hypothetical protein VGX03_16510 [Candidatus Binatia bacterium]|nr:hypothetical protein [Candidatus Binatia bacterium]